MKTKIFKFAILTIIIATVACIFSGCGGTIDLTEYVKVSEVLGCDGYGYVECELDKETLGAVIKENLKSDDELSSTIAAGLIVEAIDVDVENNGKFSNGDTIEITVSLEGEYKVKKKMVGGTITKKVKDLEPVKTADLFDAFSDIKFDGKNSLGKIAFTEKSTYENDVFSNVRDYVTYTTDNDGNLSNGDKITVTATLSDYEENNKLLLEKGYAALEEQTKEITVSGLWEPMTKDQVTDDLLSRIEKAFKEKTNCQSINYAYYFWGDAKDEYASKQKVDNSIFYYVEFVNKSGNTTRQCWYFNNCHLTANADDQPFEKFGITFYTTMGSTDKITLDKASSSVTNQMSSRYDVSVIK